MEVVGLLERGARHRLEGLRQLEPREMFSADDIFREGSKVLQRVQAEVIRLQTG